MLLITVYIKLQTNILYFLYLNIFYISKVLSLRYNNKCHIMPNAYLNAKVKSHAELKI